MPPATLSPPHGSKLNQESPASAQTVRWGAGVGDLTLDEREVGYESALNVPPELWFNDLNLENHCNKCTR
jgi:hypothetical protein